MEQFIDALEQAICDQTCGRVALEMDAQRRSISDELRFRQACSAPALGTVKRRLFEAAPRRPHHSDDPHPGSWL